MYRNILLVTTVLLCTCSASVLGVDIEQWDIFELTLKGPAGGNPFVDTRLSADLHRYSRGIY